MAGSQIRGVRSVQLEVGTLFPDFLLLVGSTENWAPLPRVFHNTNELGSVRHECELQGVMTS